MNCKEWHNMIDSTPNLLNWNYYHAARKKQKSLIYNSDPNANVIHHLRDTEEQRNYNDTYYELWGHNLDGTFEYGKYVIFVTDEWHNNYHAQSEETKMKRSVSMKKVWENDTFRYNQLTKNPMFCEDHSGENSPWYGKHHTDEIKDKISKSETGKIVSDETRNKLSIAGKGRTPPNKGIPHSAETRKKISENTRAAMTDEARKKCSEAHKGLKQSEETKLKMSESHKARVNDEFRDKMRDLQFKRLEDNNYRQFLKDTAKKQQSLKSSMYKEYKTGGGTLSWNEFQKYIKDNDLLNKYNQGDTQCLFHAKEE